ncbi:hypothetical protein MRB53_018324 [Persea americana]|uniref:Uncharacterized protein n=1 Tax=Persea americana TaxID=3435 RepID=A0ACC2M7I7_PERAE|nr:hypothetical protein MRB53_018324 [Persea americana]
MATTLPFSKSLIFSWRSASASAAPPLRPNLPLISYASRKCNLYHQTCSHLTKSTSGKVSSGQVELEDEINDEACELVSGTELTLGEGEDNIRAFLFKAVKNNNGAGVLLLSDIYGFEDSSTRDFAYRVACSGYNVLVPDLFHGNPWTKNQPRTKFEDWLTQQSPERLAKDISTSAKWMSDEFVAAGISRKLGIIGFCFGGGQLIETLAQDNSYFGTAVCFYGTQMNPSLAAKIKIPVLFISGDNDPLCPVNFLTDMEKSIEGSKVVIYYGQGHGFAHRPQSPEEDEDAEIAFTIMRDWLHGSLVAKN